MRHRPAAPARSGPRAPAARPGPRRSRTSDAPHVPPLNQNDRWLASGSTIPPSTRFGIGTSCSMAPSRNRMPTQVPSSGRAVATGRLSGPCTLTPTWPPTSLTTRCQWLEATELRMPSPVLRQRQTQSISGASEGRTSISSATNQPPPRDLPGPGRRQRRGATRTSKAALRSVPHARAYVASIRGRTAGARRQRSRRNSQAGAPNHEKMTDVMSSTEARQLAVALAA